MGDIFRDANGRWKGILLMSGVDEKFLKNDHGPCPICGGRDRFRYDDKQGNGTWYCGKCGAGNGYTLLKTIHGWSDKETVEHIKSIVGSNELPKRDLVKEMNAEKKREVIKRILSTSVKVTENTLSWTYLLARCGYVPSVKDLRHNENMKHNSGTYFPCLIAILRDKEGNGTGIQRIYLSPEGGRKAEVDHAKMCLVCASINGSSVAIGDKQSPVAVVAEGIETTISAMKFFGVKSGYAAISANGMATWNPPQHVKEIIVAGDNDASYTGQQAAYTLAKRMKLAATTVSVEIPREEGKDWNDLDQRRYGHGL
jgi:putative DNA primase/helicase